MGRQWQWLIPATAGEIGELATHMFYSFYLRIRIYSANSGRSLQSFGMQGRAAGQLEKPIDVSWDTQGHLLVLDEGRVQVFTERGEFVTAQKVNSSLHAMSAIGQCVLLSDTFCVTKCIWKIK